MAFLNNIDFKHFKNWSVSIATVRHPGRERKDSILQKIWNGFKLYCMSGLKAQFKSSLWAKAGHSLTASLSKLALSPSSESLCRRMSSGPSQCLLIKARKAYLQLLKSYEVLGKDYNILYLWKECVVLPLRWRWAVLMAHNQCDAICFREATLAPLLSFFASPKSPWLFLHMETTTTNRNNGRYF